MHRLKQVIAIALGALMLMGALSGCAEQETPEEERFVLRAGVCPALSSLDPAMNTDPRAESVFCALYENLMRMDEDENGRVAAVPGVAKEYQEIRNHDGTVDYIFTLRSSARWSDGTRVRSRDFVYAWRRLVDPETDSPNHALLSMVEGYEAVRETGDAVRLKVSSEGDSTFRVTLSAPCAYFLSEVCTAVATMPLRRDAVQKDERWMTSSNVPSNGRYQAEIWARGQYLQLRRNASYYERSTTGPEQLRFLFPSDEKAAWRLYERGDVDYIVSPPQDMEATGRLPLRSTVCVFYNHVSEVFSNAYVRAAFDLVIDRAGIAAAEGARSAPASGLVPPGIMDGAEDASDDFRGTGGELCPVDEEGYAARVLDAGTRLRNGGYWGGVGFPQIVCLYEEDDDGTRAVAAAVTALWREKLNVDVTAEGVPREEMDQRMAEGDFDRAVGTLRAEHGDAAEYLAPFAGTDGNNALHYVSKPFDLLIGVAETSGDPSARAAFLHDAEALLLGETALSPVCFGAETYLLRDGLTGVRFDLRGNVYFNTVSRTGPAE